MGWVDALPGDSLTIMNCRHFLALALVVLFAVSAGGAYVLIRSDPAPESIASGERAFVVAVERRIVEDAAPAVAIPEVVPGRELYAPPWRSGAVILELYLAPGTVLRGVLGGV